MISQSGEVLPSSTPLTGSLLVTLMIWQLIDPDDVQLSEAV